MLLTFICTNNHLFKKISENEINEFVCPECGLTAKRNFANGKIEGESFDKIDSGFQNKVVEYSAKRNELLHERSADYSREVRKKNGMNLDE
jgi:hypothetical protein